MSRSVDKYMAPWVSTGDWISWEIKRYILETETPGKFGTYGDKDAA